MTIRQIGLLLILYFLSFNLLGQAWEWKKEGQKINNLKSETDVAGNVYLTGTYKQSCSFEGINLNLTDSVGGFLIKMDANGNTLWYKLFQSHFLTIPDIQINSNSVFLAGSFRNSLNLGSTTLISAGMSDIYIANWDLAGNLIMAKRDGSSADEKLVCFNLCNNEILVSGDFSPGSIISSVSLASANRSNLFIAKYAFNGNNVWVREAVGSPGAWAHSNWIKGTPSGDFYLVGNFYNEINIEDTTLQFGKYYSQPILRYHSNGTFDKFITTLDGYLEYGHGIETDQDGNVYSIQGASGNHSSTSLEVSKFSSSGIRLWQTYTGGALDWESGGPCYGQGIKIKNNKIFISGNYSDDMFLPSPFYLSGTGVFLFEFDLNGNFLLVRNGITKGAMTGGLAIDPNNNVYITGYTPNPINFNDLTVNMAADSVQYLVKLNAFLSEPLPTITVDPSFYTSCAGKYFILHSTIKNVTYLKWNFYGKTPDEGRVFCYTPDCWLSYDTAGFHDAYVIIQNSVKRDSIYFNDIINITMDQVPKIIATGNQLHCTTPGDSINLNWNYLWFKDGSYYYDQSYNNTSTITPTLAGDYSVSVHYLNGCMGRSYPYHFDPAVIGITENALSPDTWEIFPNPSKELFIVQFNRQVKDLKLAVYDITGICVLKATLDNMSTYYIDMSEYSKGAYFIQVNNGKEIINKRVVLN